MRADPIAVHLAALDGALRGPRRFRRCMLAEARTGLRDAEDAYRSAGLAPRQAAERAVTEFGAVGEVAPAFQEELTARQGRRAAVLFAIVFPAMLWGWDALWSTGLVRRESFGTAQAVVTLAGVQDMATIMVTIAALGLLVTTFLRSVPPRGLTTAIGVTGTVGALLCGGISVAMNIAGGRSTVHMLQDNPAAVAAMAGSAVVLVLLVWQAVHTVRIAVANRPQTTDIALP